jgi:hypothetical protein
MDVSLLPHVAVCPFCSSASVPEIYAAVVAVAVSVRTGVVGPVPLGRSVVPMSEVVGNVVISVVKKTVEQGRQNAKVNRPEGVGQHTVRYAVVGGGEGMRVGRRV